MPDVPPAVSAEPEFGLASVYAADLEGLPTASGERYDSGLMTAAHRTLPLRTRIRVVDRATGKSVVVVVNDRWGAGPGWVVNLSRRAADELGMGAAGARRVAVFVEALGQGRRAAPAPEPTLLPRERVADRVESTADDRDGRIRRCENEADILGLKDEWRDRHVHGCVERAGQTGRR